MKAKNNFGLENCTFLPSTRLMHFYEDTYLRHVMDQNVRCERDLNCFKNWQARVKQTAKHALYHVVHYLDCLKGYTEIRAKPMQRRV